MHNATACVPAEAESRSQLRRTCSALFFGKIVERPPQVIGHWSHTSSGTRRAGVGCEYFEPR